MTVSKKEIEAVFDTIYEKMEAGEDYELCGNEDDTILNRKDATASELTRADSDGDLMSLIDYDLATFETSAEEVDRICDIVSKF